MISFIRSIRITLRRRCLPGSLAPEFSTRRADEFSLQFVSIERVTNASPPVSDGGRRWRRTMRVRRPRPQSPQRIASPAYFPESNRLRLVRPSP